MKSGVKFSNELLIMLDAAVGFAAGAACAAALYYVIAQRLTRRSDTEPALVQDPETWAARHHGARASVDPGYYAFYSSVAGAITTNVALMAVPIDDHCIVRGHAVFDTCSLVGGRMYRLQIHLDRLFASAKAARLPLPFGDDEAANRSRMTAIVRATCKASGKSDCDVRFWLTAGTGNLGVTPAGCRPSFFVLCFGGLPALKTAALDGSIAEVTIPESVVPLKPPHLAQLKSNNYLLNALTMMAAAERGGTFGIGVTSSGYLTESCVLNVIVVGKDGALRTPPFEGILCGTTVRRVFELARQHLVGSAVACSAVAGSAVAGSAVVGSAVLGSRWALLSDVRQEPIRADEARDAAELMLVAGDTHVCPITTLDGHKIGSGKPGPVFAALKRLLEEDAGAASGEHIEAL
jgi:branched-subunit amino acid aminotransferase/4-amino-4-deoxychorismate lyase